VHFPLPVDISVHSGQSFLTCEWRTATELGTSATDGRFSCTLGSSTDHASLRFSWLGYRLRNRSHFKFPQNTKSPIPRTLRPIALHHTQAQVSIASLLPNRCCLYQISTLGCPPRTPYPAPYSFVWTALHHLNPWTGAIAMPGRPGLPWRHSRLHLLRGRLVLWRPRCHIMFPVPGGEVVHGPVGRASGLRQRQIQPNRRRRLPGLPCGDLQWRRGLVLPALHGWALVFRPGGSSGSLRRRIYLRWWTGETILTLLFQRLPCRLIGGLLSHFVVVGPLRRRIARGLWGILPSLLYFSLETKCPTSRRIVMASTPSSQQAAVHSTRDTRSLYAFHQEVPWFTASPSHRTALSSSHLSACSRCANPVLPGLTRTTRTSRAIPAPRVTSA